MKAERRGRRSWRLDKDVVELCSRLLTLDNAKASFALCSLNRSLLRHQPERGHQKSLSDVYRADTAFGGLHVDAILLQAGGAVGGD